MTTHIRETRELLLIAEKLGSKLFDERSIKFMSAKAHRTVHRGKFFITHRWCYLENTDRQIRRYTVWKFEITEDSVNFEIVGEPDQYQMHQQASEAIRHL